MKKVLILSLCLFSCAFGASSKDIEIANTLASQGIIDNHANNPTLYNLSSPILRQEMIGIALRMSKIPLPSGYFCRNYFFDVRYNKQNNWVCRAIEIAADYGIISNKNGTMRPTDPLTRSEALGIILKSGNIDYPRNVPRSASDASLAQWQVDAINGGLLNKIILSNQ